MFRSRDFVAALMVVVLVRMAWNDNLESLSASVHLAFYFPREKTVDVVPFDVDGDGTSEALAVIKKTEESNWILQILDLKPLHHQGGKTHLAPFQPNVLFQSSYLKEGTAQPLKLTTGQVVLEKPEKYVGKKKPEEPKQPRHDPTDKARFYFCGKDWHDASSRCATPCPTGQSTECGDGEQCFADTPCDSHAQKHTDPLELKFDLTPGGGLPSVVTLWSNGVLSLHSLSGKGKLESSDEDSSSKQKKTTSKDLALQRMWRTTLLPQDHADAEHRVWGEVSLRFLDAYESEAGSSENGIVVINGGYEIHEESDEEGDDDLYLVYINFVIAVDAMTGKKVWDSVINDDADRDVLPLPLHRGSTSYARRRSRIASLHQDSIHGTAIERGSLPNCQVVFKQSFLSVLPHAFWTYEDATVYPMHLDHKTKHKRRDGDTHLPSNEGHAQDHRHAAESRTKHGHHKNKGNRHSANFGRPNVLVSSGEEGIHIRSLRNGRLLCHMTMEEGVLYADLNGDKIVDQVEIILPSHEKDASDKFIWNLIRKVSKEVHGAKEGEEKAKIERSKPKVCHALALSGIPAREELFSAPICGSQRDRAGEAEEASIEALAPIVVESLGGRRGSKDIIVALSNGMVSRLHGTTGRREWQLAGKNSGNFPTWKDDGYGISVLTRLESGRVAPSIRPALLIGENGMAIISVKSGDLLASTEFPQTSITRPVLAEISGDETMDVIIISSEAVWGYQLIVRPGNFIVIRTLVGLVVMGLMLAILRNRFGPKKDQRSTDAYQ